MNYVGKSVVYNIHTGIFNFDLCVCGWFIACPLKMQQLAPGHNTVIFFPEHEDRVGFRIKTSKRAMSNDDLCTSRASICN